MALEKLPRPPNRTLPAHDLRLREGLIMHRPAEGQILEIPQRLGELQATYPELQVMGLPDGRGNYSPNFGVKQLIARKHRPPSSVIGRVGTRAVLEDMLSEVPGLQDELPMRITGVDINYGISGGIQIELVPHAFDVIKLAKQKYQMIEIVREHARQQLRREGTSGASKGRWEELVLDVPVAYFPGHEVGAVETIVETLESDIEAAGGTIGMDLQPIAFKVQKL
jgi:hypothetical protein